MESILIYVNDNNGGINLNLMGMSLLPDADHILEPKCGQF